MATSSFDKKWQISGTREELEVFVDKLNKNACVLPAVKSDDSVEELKAWATNLSNSKK